MQTVECMFSFHHLVDMEGKKRMSSNGDLIQILKGLPWAKKEKKCCEYDFLLGGMEIGHMKRK